MCAPLGDIDKSGGLFRPEAFSALGNYGVSVCIFPEEQRHALPDPSALQTVQRFPRQQDMNCGCKMSPTATRGRRKTPFMR